MQTIERESTEATVDNERLTKRSRWLGWMSGVLAVAVLSLGAWLIFDSGSEAADLTPVQEQMLETIDTYLDAWNTGDGAAAVALMSASGYHDNGSSRYHVAEGELENFIETAHGMNISVSRSDAAFVGDYVMSTEHIPADSDVGRPSIYWMSTDGTRIMWHLAPQGDDDIVGGRGWADKRICDWVESAVCGYGDVLWMAAAANGGSGSGADSVAPQGK